jgi:hemolysin activation/secretion protein
MTRIFLILFTVIAVLFSLSAFAADVDRGEIPRFEIRNYRVEGNTLIAADKLEAILAPFTGTVQEAHEALENAYRSRGFYMVVVTLPEQEIEKGIIRLKVVEKHIGKIRVEGNRFFDPENIQSSVPALRQGDAPDLNALSRSLKIANENPAKKINVSLQNSDIENEVDANIAVKDEKPWKAGITANNSGTRETGKSRVGFLLQHANIADLDHLLTLQYITSPEKPDRVSIYSAGYRLPFYSAGSSIDLIAAYSNVDSGTITAAVTNLDVSGKGTILGVRYNQNLTRIGGYEHKAIFGLDWRDYKNTVDLLGFQLGNDITVHPLIMTYAGNWTSDKSSAGFYLTDMFNLPGNWGGKDSAADLESARAGAERNYNIIRYGANLTYLLGGDWQARAVVNGQYTDDMLVASEQYGIGGSNTVRGFEEREFANDRGISGSIEIYSPDLSGLIGIKDIKSRALLFYDRGYVSRIDPLPGEVKRTEIASFGPGLRVTDGKRFSVSADVGIIVDPPDRNTSRWSSGWHISASLLF